MKKNIIVVKSLIDYVDKIDTQPKSLLKESVVVYCRVSTKQQTKGDSLDDQQKWGIQFFKEQKIDKIDYKNIIVIREEGRSGDDYSSNEFEVVSRPLLQSILNEVKKNNVKFFWCYDSNRMCRSSEIGNEVWKIFRNHNVNFYVGNSKKNVTELNDKFYWMLMNVVDEIENEKRFYRGLVGKISSIKKGKFWGGRYQYGYMKGNQNGHIVVDRTKSKYVRKMFEMYLNGNSIKDIIIYLNKENVQPPKSDKTIWNSVTIRNILCNETYIGKKTYIVKKLKGETKSRCVELGQIEEITQTNLPKIVDKEVFDSVQKLLETERIKSTHRGNHRKYIYLLSDMLYCGCCGNSMKIKNNPKQKTKIYFCDYKIKSWKYFDDRYPKCNKENTKSINIDVTDTLVWNEVLRLFKDSYIIKEQFKNKYLPLKQKDKETPLNQIKSYKKKISEHNKNIRRLKKSKIELFGKKLLLEMDESTFIRFEEDIDVKIGIENDKIFQIQNDINGIEQNIKWYDWLEDFDNKFDEIKEYRSLESKRNFLKKYVNKIDVTYNKNNNTHSIKIYFKFHIVKDERIRKEKYVFEVKKGQNVSVINDINSLKIKYLLNKEKKQTTSFRNHSTVTDFFQNEVLSPKNESKKSDYSLDLSFTLFITSSKLTKTSHYNSYQQKLYRLIKFLKEERGIGYRRISHILTEKGYRSVRTNSILKNNYIHSIYKKGKVRENRIERSFDSKIEDINCTVKYSI